MSFLKVAMPEDRSTIAPSAPPAEEGTARLKPAPAEEEEGFLTWYGGIHRRRDLRLTGAALLGPPLVWLLIFLALPCAGLAVLSLAQRGDYGGLNWVLSLDNYRRLLGYGLFGWSPDHLLILGRSLWVGVVTTVLCALL
ncbi:MAG: hypothetical protein LBV21_03270, partial [Candidatus Adiutrix sp.]|nr:hypothetical protein [Candidatus Adiutrix sp.]